ncbi:MAG: toll/interleukin-1 receptor domain-containing protein, partial [Verrucomicrobia bacterium]|nr:toll/interleukin-1 receptor domain-containing protein [Verrucomicrobiota bacterium]
PDIRPDLRGADLNHANLRNVDLGGADLSRANLLSVDFREANLCRANLNHADLHLANLENANLRNALLGRADLSGSFLANADLSEASLWSTIFAENDLSEVKGLEIVKHGLPSTIGIDTLYRSGGKIPEVFLRGAGVPDVFINYLPSLVNAEQATQYYSCFISYSTKDEEFAKRLHSRLQQEHVRAWIAPEDMKGGRKLEEQIDEAIRVHDKLLIVLSENSIHSEWVKTEIRRACKAEVKENCRKLFPLGIADYEIIKDWKLFDADLGKDLAVEVREYFIPGFASWKNQDAFEKAFKRLLKDLQPKATAKQSNL